MIQFKKKMLTSVVLSALACFATNASAVDLDLSKLEKNLAQDDLEKIQQDLGDNQSKDLVINRVATDPKDPYEAIIGKYAPLDITLMVKNFHAQSEEKGVLLLNAGNRFGISAAENIEISSAGHTLDFQAQGSTSTSGSMDLQAGGNILLASKGGWAVHLAYVDASVPEGGHQLKMVAGNNIEITSAYGVKNDVGSSLYVEAGNDLTIDSKTKYAVINQSGESTYKAGNNLNVSSQKHSAIWQKNSGTLNLNGKNIAISIAEPQTNTVIDVDDGEVHIRATEKTSIVGQVDIAENGSLILGGKLNDLNGDIAIHSGLLTLDGGLTVLNGNLSLANSAQKVASLTADATPVDSQMVLKNAAQFQVNGKVDGANANVSLSDGSNLQLEQGGSLGQVMVSESTVTTSGATQIDTLVGKTATVKIADANATVQVNKNEVAGVQLSATGNVTDAMNGDIKGFVQNVTIAEGEQILNQNVTMEQGSVVGKVTMNEKGEVIEAVNTDNQAKQETLLQTPRVITRVMMNDVRKRMGDLRAGEGQSGVWARYNGGKLSGEGQLTSDFNMIQAGIDTMPTADSGRFGVALSYAQADTENLNTKADMDAFSLAGYGVWMQDNGMFVDIIARMAKVDTDLSAGLDNAKIDNLLLGVSGEWGWRFDVNEQMYVEPSAELSYTYTEGETFKMGALNHKLGSTDSLVARIGAAAGFKCPNDYGNVYVRVAGVHEFLGDSSFTTDNGAIARTVESDGKDTWFEYGIGANFNVNKATYVYADVERTSGSVLDEDWRANVGVRYSF